MFRKFCKPTINPVLSDFCKDLTGVNQVGTLDFYISFTKQAGILSVLSQIHMHIFIIRYVHA